MLRGNNIPDNFVEHSNALLESVKYGLPKLQLYHFLVYCAFKIHVLMLWNVPNVHEKSFYRQYVD